MAGERGTTEEDESGSYSEVYGGTEFIQQRERQLKEAGSKVSNRIRTSFAQFTDLTNLTELDFPLDGVVVRLKADLKAFEAELDLDKGDVDLSMLRYSFAGQADLGPILDQLVPEGFPLDATVTLELRVEVTLGSDELKTILQMRKAADTIKDGISVKKRAKDLDDEIKRVEKALDDLKQKGGPRRYPDIYDPKPKLERRLGKLRKNREALKKVIANGKKATEAAAKAYAAARDKLGKGLASVADTVVGRALGKTLSKLLPVYNAITTAQDIYDIATWIWDWEPSVEGGSSQEGIGDGKEGGTGNTPNDTESSGSEDESGAQSFDDSLLEPVEDPFAPVPMHAAAQRITAQTSGGSVQLSAEDRELIATIVPENLSDAEIAQIVTRLYAETIGGTVETGEQYIEALIESVRWVQTNRREDGHPGAPPPDHEVREREREPDKPRARDHEQPKPGDGDAQDARDVTVDVVAELAAHYRFHETEMEIVGPKKGAVLELSAVTVRLTERFSFQSMMTQERYALVYVEFEIISSAPQVRMVLGTTIVDAVVGEQHAVEFGVTGELAPSPSVGAK